MEQELDYAEMLEIPVSTVSVVKKKSLGLFKRKAEPAQPRDDLKDMVVESVNERVGAYTFSEDLSEEPAAETAAKTKTKDKGNNVIVGELIAVCLIAVAIFVTNLFMPTSLINTFIGSFNKTEAAVEPTYSEIKLSPVVSELAEADVSLSASGVISFTAASAVYPVSAGKISSVTKMDNTYTVQIAHTSTFSSVITGLSEVYSAAGTAVAANIPFAYSNGETPVSISLYDGETLLNCYTLANEVPVWNS